MVSRKTIAYIYLVLAVLLFTILRPMPFHQAAARNGVVDLQQWNPQDNQLVKLNGEWDFYPDNLVADIQGPDTETQAAPESIRVPGTWNDHEKADGEVMDGYGFATYHLSVRLPKGGHYAIHLPDTATACNLYINGVSAGGAGLVGRTADVFEAQYKPTVYCFQTGQNLEVMIEVANFIHRKGGLWDPLFFGTVDAVQRYKHISLSLQMFLLGALFICFVYNLLMFVSNPAEKSYLWLGLFSLGNALRILVTGNFLITILFPSLPFTVYTTVEYLTSPLITVAGIYLLKQVHPWLVKGPLYNGMEGICYASMAAFLVLPLRIDNIVITGFMVLIIIIFLITFLRAIYFAAAKNLKTDLLFNVGYAVLLLTFINDTLYVNQVHFLFQYANALPFGMLFLILTHIVSLAYKYHSALETSRQLSDNLESKVRQRTRALEEANTRLNFYAVTDPLTGLYNRKELDERLHQISSSRDLHRSLAVLYLDLDNFKYYNDTYGHAAGDYLLTGFAEILKKAVRGSDPIFRIGGDEFLVLIENGTIEAGQKLSDRVFNGFGEQEHLVPGLKTFLNQPHLNPQCLLTCSVGIAMTREFSDQNLRQMIDEADLALIQAKQQGKNRVVSR